MRIFWVPVAVLLLFIGTAPGLSQTVLPVEPFRLTVDLSRFRGADDNHVHVELYFAFPRRSLTFRSDTAGFVGAGDLTFTAMKGDSLVYADRWLVPHVLRDTASVVPGLTLVGNAMAQLEPGDYVFKLLGRDRNNASRADSVTLKVPIRPIVIDRPVFSDIEFASIIRQGTKGGAFYKNTLDVVPNVGGIFLENQNCFFYAEAYNLARETERNDYYLRTNVHDAVGKEIMSREKPKRHLSESSVIVDNFPASTLRTGTYTLVLSLLDTSKKVLTSSARKFYVYNKTLGVDSSLLASASGLPLAEYMSMDSVELDREFKWSKWEALDQEKSQYGQLRGSEAKRKFLTDFWRRRPPGHREDYLARVAYANNNFNMMQREGYRTDRGRVHIVYGVPEDIERHPNETDMKPYEIWYYTNIQGGVQFVFVQRNAGGDFELVHSTHRNELHDENWQRIASAQ